MSGALFIAIFYEKSQKQKENYFLAFSFSMVDRKRYIPLMSVPGFSLIILTLKGSMVCMSTNIVRCVSTSRETVLWCKPVRLAISLIHNQPSSAPFRHLTILIMFSAVSFLIVLHLKSDSVSWRTSPQNNRFSRHFI